VTPSAEEPSSTDQFSPTHQKTTPSADPFNIQAFFEATSKLDAAISSLRNRVESRRRAVLRHLLPNVKLFSWEFDEDHFQQTHEIRIGALTMHLTDGTSHELGLKDEIDPVHSKEYRAAMNMMRPHLREGVTDQEADLVWKCIVKVLDEGPCSLDVQEWELDSVEYLRQLELGVPDLTSNLGGWSSPAIPWPPAPPEEAKKGSSRKKKR